MFRPQYSITNRLLSNIKHINSLVLQLNNQKFPQMVLVKLEKQAQAVSTFASTNIEGNPLPLTDVKRTLKIQPQNARVSEQEVLNYNQALEQLTKKLKKGQVPLTANLILSVHRQVVNSLVPNHQAGQLRQDPVFVNNPQTQETVYLPPDAPDVPALINELVKYIHRNQGIVDPLILAGIFHKQFVIIHPFMDGNGRTARLATKILLVQMGLDTFNLFSFENYYNQNVTNYFHQVGAFGNYYDLVSSLDFTPWLEYFTNGIIDELLRVKGELLATPPTPQTELKPHHQKILSFIEKKGYITDRDYARLTNRAKATRTLDFKKLLNLDLIHRRGRGKATYYQLKTDLKLKT